MTAREFFDLAADLRFFQTLYRYSGSLRARSRAARLERKMDGEITRVTGILRKRKDTNCT